MTLHKPADFGAGGVTGSLDADGRIIALNFYHAAHGYVTLTTADPFPESERYNPAAVRAYRAGLVSLRGFGLHFDEPIIQREAALLDSAIPHLRLIFQNGGAAEVTTLAHERGVVQIWDVRGVTPRWQGKLCLQRSAYTQLTEGGPLPMPPLALTVTCHDRLVVENTILGAAVVMAGLKSSATPDILHSDQPVNIALTPVQPEFTVLAYGAGSTVEQAAENADWLHTHARALLDQTLADWQGRWQNLPADPLLRRGLVYGLATAVPVGDTICLLTDHMLLPLSWNRDAYYVARALLSWGLTDIVRRHLLWLFETAERDGGLWSRCYLANGRIKDGAFQLDQQLFPLLELAEYTLETGDQATWARLQPHVRPLLEQLLARKAAHALLLPTDETPADDPIALPYHFSSHLLFWRVLTRLNQLGFDADGLAAQCHAAINRHFISEQAGRPLYAYATDGGGRYHFYHDANDIPLALAARWGFVAANDPVWRATLDFAFSEANVGGAYAGRLGSVHTRAPWPLGDVQDLIMAQSLNDAERANRARDRLRAAAQWDGALPEACDAQTNEVVSRHWFAWPNAALACVELGAFDR